MNEEYMKKIYNLSSVAWKKYKEWAAVKIELRNDHFWERVCNDIKKTVNEYSDAETKQFMTNLLNAYAGQIDVERNRNYEQGELKL